MRVRTFLVVAAMLVVCPGLSHAGPQGAPAGGGIPSVQEIRAIAEEGYIYGNDATEAVYPMAKAERDGQPLDGSQHAYTLTFAPGQLPPVSAFWSLTIDDGKTQLLIKNPIARYLINSSMLSSLAKGPDGSVTIDIQRDSPGHTREANWLPAPNGPIYLVMRLYWPKTEAPSILPPGNGTWQPPALVRAAGSANKRPSPQAPEISGKEIKR
jgi:hypothetical protein